MQSGASRVATGQPFRLRRKRHHLHESVIQRAVKEAVRRAGLTKPASCHTLGIRSPRTLLEDGYDIRTVQELLGHKDVKTTMIYTMYSTGEERGSGARWTDCKGERGARADFRMLG
jgi:site-specific recombinase XerD